MAAALPDGPTDTGTSPGQRRPRCYMCGLPALSGGRWTRLYSVLRGHRQQKQPQSERRPPESPRCSSSRGKPRATVDSTSGQQDHDTRLWHPLGAAQGVTGGFGDGQEP
ncbi:unnamed protein product [Boreogadus saida]